MVPKILKPIRQKDIFNKKSYLAFNIKVPLGDGFPMSSDFIFNTNIFNDDLYINTNSFNYSLNNREFTIVKRINDEAGQSLFQDHRELISIPKKYLDPPIHISSYQFTADLGQMTKQNMTMISMHDPLNITYDTMSPFPMYLNPYNVSSIWSNFILFFSRIPIFCKYGNEYWIANMSCVFDNDWVGLHAFFTKNFNLAPNFANFRRFLIKKYDGRYVGAPPNAVRQISATEKDNLIFDLAYSDGRFFGVNSPQPNDWYLNRNDNLQSNFNNVSFIKCALEICMLAAAWNETKNFTLGNGAIFINITPQGNVKFTGKYFRKSPGTIPTTLGIFQYAFTQFKSSQELRQQINNEIEFDLTNLQFNNFVPLVTVVNETRYHPNYTMYDYAVKNLFLCVNGLEEWYRSNLALWLAGVYGHIFDFVLRYFDPMNTSANQMAMEVQLFKMTYKSFQFVQHIGSPLASYCYDFKTIPQENILLGYNLGNFGKLVNMGCLSVSDQIKYNTVYRTKIKPVALFPVIYQNINFIVNISVWRSFRPLLSLMKTRQQRDIVMDHLNTYGRRCFTILDPYGIFLHFHNETKGLRPAD